MSGMLLCTLYDKSTISACSRCWYRARSNAEDSSRHDNAKAILKRGRNVVTLSDSRGNFPGDSTAVLYIKVGVALSKLPNKCVCLMDLRELVTTDD